MNISYGFASGYWECGGRRHWFTNGKYL